MKNLSVLSVFVGILGLLLFLNACGQLQESLGAASEPLSVHLVLPEQLEPELFWSGVVRKELVWKKAEEAEQRFPWESLSSVQEDFSGPGTLRFEGRSGSGNLLVEAQEEIQGQKQVFLRLQRIIY